MATVMIFLVETLWSLWEISKWIFQVVPRGSQFDIVHSIIDTPYIQGYFDVLTLTQNMWLQGGYGEQEKKDIADFFKWLLKIGEGRLSKSNDGYVEIEIPHEILITNFVDPIVSIVESTYSEFTNIYTCSAYLKIRKILTSTIKIVDQINDYILQMMSRIHITLY